MEEVFPTIPDFPTTGMPDAATAGILAGMGIMWFVMILVFYVYYGVCLMKMAKKVGLSDGWWAWIPILNVLLMLKIAGKPMWWILLYLIPLVNIVIAVIVWMGIAERLGKPSYWGILMIIPVISFFVPAYLAFSNDGSVQTQPVQLPPTPTQPTQPQA